jgi:hypothetical protein
MDRTLGQPESKVIPFPRPENDAATRLARQRHGSKPCHARAKLWLGIRHGWGVGLGKVSSLDGDPEILLCPSIGACA